MAGQPKEVIVCGFCKTTNNPNEKFCKNCGTLLKRTKGIQKEVVKKEPRMAQPKTVKEELRVTQPKIRKEEPKITKKAEIREESSNAVDEGITRKIALIVMVLALIIIVGIGTYQFLTYKIRDNLKERVQKKVAGTWVREENPTFTAQLVIGKDTIVYYYVNKEGEAQKISENSYEVIQGDCIEVAGRGEIQISWEEDGTVMKMQPALTSAKSEEQWSKR